MTLEFLIVLVGLVGSAFYSGIETGIVSIHRMRLEHSVRKGDKGTDKLQAYLDHPDRLLGATLVGNNICNVVVSIVSASIAVRILGDAGEAVSSVMVALVILVVGEYIPKAWFLGNPLERCGRFVGFLWWSELALRPISKTVIRLAAWIFPGSSKGFSTPVPLVTREDIKTLAREGEKDGELSARERSMIHRVFELSHKRARDVMVPRANMAIVEGDLPLARFFDKARESGYTRFPVFDKTAKTFTGILNLFFVLSTPEEQRHRPVADFLRAPLIIKEDMPVDDILPRLRHARQPMCLVADARGEVTGLVTVEDILKEIVGTL